MLNKQETFDQGIEGFKQERKKSMVEYTAEFEGPETPLENTIPW